MLGESKKDGEKTTHTQANGDRGGAYGGEGRSKGEKSDHEHGAWEGER